MFLLVSLSKSKFFPRVALASFVQHPCLTHLVRVALVSHLYRTRVALVSLVSHSCCIRVARVALVSLVSGTRVVNQTRFKKCLIFLKSYVKLEILIFFPLWCLFQQIYSLKKLPFQIILHQRQQRSYRKLTWQSIKGKFHHWQKLDLGKVVHNVKPHR